MYVDPNHEGLKKYRAFRAEKKVVAILALDYGKEHPEATPAECKAAALAIREEQLKAVEENQKVKSKKRRPKKSVQKKSTDMNKVEVVVVNKVSDES